MSTRDKLNGAAALKRLRIAHGWSLSEMSRLIIDMAARLGQPLYVSAASVQRTVARWESAGAPILPSERYQVLLAHLYARGLGGQACVGTGSDFAELLDALGHLGESERCLGELRALVLRTATDAGEGLLALLGPPMRRALSVALAAPSRLDAGLIEAMRDAVSTANGQVGSIPFTRLRLVLTPITESCRRLLGSAVPQALLPDLKAVAAHAYTLSGRCAFESRDDTAARALYFAATEAATGLDPPWRRAVVHLSHALVTLYSTPGLDTARELVDAAVRDARAGESLVIRARAHALQAEVAARAGQERHARAALALARYDLDRAKDADPATSSFSPAHLDGFEGITNLYVGDLSEAHDHLARSAEALVAPRERVQRSIVATDQAIARIRLGDPRSGVELLHECIDVATETGGRVAAIRLRHARRDLCSWRREDFVADLDDHMIEAFGG
jgi:transcriptional regulator with XRE-family HTH domain